MKGDKNMTTQTFASHYEQKRAYIEKLIATKGKPKKMEKVKKEYFHYLGAKKEQ
jgi:hypothetical protein